MELQQDGKLAETVFYDISERLHPRPKRDVSFYLVLVGAVLPIWFMVPLSWAYVIYTLRTGQIWALGWCGRTLFIAALCEVFFNVHHCVLAWYIAPSSSLPLHSLGELRSAFKRMLRAGLVSLPEVGCNHEPSKLAKSTISDDFIHLRYDDPRAVDFRNYLRTWFGKVPWSSIRRHEFYAWLYWSIFNARFTSFDQVPEPHQLALRDVLHMIELRSGSTIPEGSNPAAKPILLTLDPVCVYSRPLVWYAGVMVCNLLSRVYLMTQWDVTFGTYNGLDYVLRVPPHWSSATGPRPVVFLHGLGLGLAHYQPFISQLLRSLPNHPILIPLQPHISQQIFHPHYLKPMNRRVMSECLAGLMNKLGWVRLEEGCPQSLPKPQPYTRNGEKVTQMQSPLGVTMLSHSNGSFVHAWMLKRHPELITRSCFVDPVAFCSWEGDVCYNFLYRPCSTGIDLLMKYYVGTELGVANVLQRHFDWYSNSLWYEDIPNALDPTKTMFFLGGKDSILNAKRIKRYLTEHGVLKGLWFEPNLRHGQILLPSSPGHHALLRWLHNHEVPVDAPSLS
ncbi:hypothetical protein SCP_0209080 [Sparassis crispa]|uniref:Alpha/beta-hydrolase n=1 Tax=Sparassis crispa TaxID=139825 RepID=A0A401GC26_9APHY|nr:hypothetical protein SCP_0209080 [Sparassis crispa]GBE79707.1 hypothetical protein SCP_0209080 [Sparassis crispa]